MIKECDIPFPLKMTRVHEIFGPSAISFALIAAREAGLPLLWITQPKSGCHLFPEGVMDFLSPDQLLIAYPANATDALAVAEEALKDKSVRTVVLESCSELNLREGRRLQLAAKTGGGLGLCLIRENMGSNASETRWYCEGVYDPKTADSTLMRWECKKNKSGTIGVWYVRWDRTAHRLHMVPPPAI
jgi:protein ImuA